MNYLDDYIGVSTAEKADSEFLSLLNLLKQVGLPVNKNKVEPAGTKITCLGVLIDTQLRVIAIPDEKNDTNKENMQGMVK